MNLRGYYILFVDYDKNGFWYCNKMFLWCNNNMKTNKFNLSHKNIWLSPVSTVMRQGFMIE